MSYLLDTSVLSELRRRKPDSHVLHWVEARPASVLFLSVLSLGEMRRGVEALAAGRRRAALLDWLEVDLTSFFAGRLLGVDLAVTDRWGRMLAHATRPLPVIGGLLAATALHHGLTLVTRHAHEFDIEGLDIIDPWQANTQ